MFDISYTAPTRHSRFMTNETGVKDIDQPRVYGRAIKRFRDLAEKSQAQVAEDMGVTQQAVQRYEKGQGGGLLQGDTLDRFLGAIGFSRSDLERQISQKDEPVLSPASPPPARLSVLLDTEARMGDDGYNVYKTNDTKEFDLQYTLDDDCRVMQVINEEAVPYAEPGGFVVYHLKNTPRRGQGVVIRLKGGAHVIRKYVRTTASHIETVRYEQRTLDSLPCYVEVPHNIPLSEAARPFPITLRGD